MLRFMVMIMMIMMFRYDFGFSKEREIVSLVENNDIVE